MQTLLKTETEEDFAVRHDNVQVKLEPPDHDSKVEILIEIYPKVKQEVVIGPVVLQKPEHSVIPDDMRVKLEPPDCEVDAGLTAELHGEHEVKEVISGDLVLQKPGPPAQLVSRAVTANSSVLKHPSRCGLCGQDIISSSSLTQHECTRAANTSPRDMEERGDQAPTKFTNDICLRMFTCKICNKQFSRSSNLTRHQRIHSGDKPYSCTICNKQFTQNSNLITHERVHSGDKPYPCKICNKQFSQISHLKAHRLIHSGERPYPCTICDKQFSDRSNLTKHQRLHSDDKPHSCTICSKQFNHHSDLNRHERSHIEGFKLKARLRKRSRTKQQKQ